MRTSNKTPPTKCHDNYYAAMASLSKLDIDDQSFSLYLLIQPNGDSLELRAFDGAESWTGKLTGRQIKEMAGKVICAR